MNRTIATIILFIASLKGFSQQTILATGSANSLYSFDLTNCTRHFIGTTGSGFLDIAFTSDGQLWGINGVNLYHIDTITANTTLVGNMGINPVSLVGLNDTTLLAEYGMKLYGINTNNATSFYIDSIGYEATGDLTWYDDDLYMVTSTIYSPIIRIVMNNTYTGILNVTKIGLNIPPCEGAVTASFVGDYNSIVGFNGPNLYKICQLDGSYDMLCPSLNIGGTSGAASIRLATQIPQPTSCRTVGVPNISLTNLYSISPNPSHCTFTIECYTSSPLSVTIFDALGREVYQQTIRNPHSEIRNSFSPGVYFVRVSDGERMFTQKLVVQ